MTERMTVPQFATEAEEAAWWYEHREELAAAFRKRIAAAANSFEYCRRSRNIASISHHQAGRNNYRNFRPSAIAYCQYRFKRRVLLFVIDDPALDSFESGPFEEAAQLDFGESEPGVGVHVAGLLETVLLQIEDHDTASRLQ